MSNANRHRPTFGDRVRAAREARNLSRWKLGNLVGLSSSVVRDIEHGNRLPRLVVMERLAAALDTSLSALCDGVQATDAHGWRGHRGAAAR